MRCARCGSEIVPGDMFCGDCGQPAPGSQPPQPATSSPAYYPPPRPASARGSPLGGCLWFSAGCLVGIAVTVLALAAVAYIALNAQSFSWLTPWMG